MSLDSDQKRKKSLYTEKSRDNDQKRFVCKLEMAALKLFINFHSQN